MSFYDQKKISEVEGVIDSDIQVKSTPYGTKRVFELDLKEINFDGTRQKATGRILINMFQRIDLNYGDRLRIEGVLFKPKSDPSEKFSYQRYLEDHGLFFILSVGKRKGVVIVSHNEGHWWIKASLKIRERFKRVLEKYLEPQEVGMIQAMTLGDKSTMSKDMYELFSKTGTAHIIAISGMNMAIIGAIILFILKVMHCSRRWQLILTALFLLCYAVICGWSASVVRSVIMASVILSSFCLEHESDGINSLGFAAIILFLFNPSNLFDIGFQLSFLCVFIIMIFYPKFQPMVEKTIENTFLKYVTQVLLISVIIWIGITPLIAYQFGIISFISIIANIPIVVLSDMIIALSLGLMMIGLCCAPLAVIFAGSLKAVFNLTLLLVFGFAQIPGGYVYIMNIQQWCVILYYAFLLTIIFIVMNKRASFKKH